MVLSDGMVHFLKIKKKINKSTNEYYIVALNMILHTNLGPLSYIILFIMH